MNANNTLLCVSLATTSNDETIELLQSADYPFDVGEVRLDYLKSPDLQRIIASSPRPVLCTNRLARDGGKWNGDEARRLKLVAEADALGADYVDCEIEARDQYDRPGRAKLIVSYHNFDETPENLPEIARQIEETDADIVKLATMATSLEDNLLMFHILRTARKPTIAVTMGEHGHVSRVLGPKFSAFLVFAALDAKRAAAPGQVPVHDFVDLYRFREVGPATQCYGLIGDPTNKLISHAVLNAAFRHCDIDSVCLPMRVEHIDRFILAFKDLPISGYAVAPPHNKTVVSLLDDVESSARLAGAVDTIVARNNRLYGSNTNDSATGEGIEHNLTSEPRLDGYVNRIAQQFELWTNTPAPRDLMRAEAKSRLQR